MELITEGKTSTTQRIESLQGLRTVLFLLIFAFHTSMIGNVTESTAYQSFFAGGGGRRLLRSSSFFPALLKHFISEKINFGCGMF